MKKFIVFILLVSIQSLLHADSACQKYPYRWGVKTLEPIQCYCPCERYTQPNYKCMQCKHKRVPTALKISSNPKEKSTKK